MADDAVTPSPPWLAVRPVGDAAVGPLLERVLRARRSSYNQRVAELVRTVALVDAADITTFFTDDLQPLLEGSAGAGASDDDVVRVADAAVAVGLREVGRRTLGAQARSPWITLLWREVLPRLPVAITVDPGLVGELTQATHVMASFETARPAQWLRLLGSVGPRAERAADIRVIGRVLAWRSGLAHYRDGALAALAALPPALVAPSLDLAVDATDASVATDAAEAGGAHAAYAPDVLLAQLRADRWWRPPGGPERGIASSVAGEPAEWAPTQEGVRSVGGFRGLGGRFVSPPTVVRVADELHVVSANGSWLLTADAFGATLHGDGAQAVARAASPAADRDAAQRRIAGIAHFAASAPVTSAVTWDGALVLTTARSHAVSVLVDER